MFHCRSTSGSCGYVLTSDYTLSDLTLDHHDVYLGESGCGKSTVIQLLERFYDVTRGQVVSHAYLRHLMIVLNILLRFMFQMIDGVDIRQLNIHSLRSCFGLISQEPILFNLSIADNIGYGMGHVSMVEIIDAATKANIHDFIQQLPDVSVNFMISICVDCVDVMCMIC